MVTFTFVIAAGLLLPAAFVGPMILALIPAAPLLILRHRACRIVGCAGLAATLLALHLAYAQAHRPPVAMEGVDVRAEGRVVSLVEREAGRVRFEMVPERTEPWPEGALLPRRIRLSQYGGEVMPAAGERWRWTVRLKRPRGFSNPVRFDYEAWLAAEHIDATGYVRAAPPPRRLTTGAGLAHWRAGLSEAIAGALPRGRATAIIQALVVGDRRGFDDPLWELFRDTGTSHLMAISGLHVGMVAGLGVLLVGAWGRVAPGAGARLPRRDVALVTGLAAGAIYAALAGFALPTVRAILMLAMVAAALLLRRRVAGPRVLALAAVIILAIDPWAVLSAGFWLSFGAVALLFSVLARRGPGVPGGMLLRTQLVVGIGMVPLTWLFFGQIAWVGIPANLIAIPVFSLVVIPAALLGTLLLGLWPAAGGLLLNLLSAMLDAILVALEAAAELGRSTDLSAPLHGLPMWVPAAVVILLAIGRNGRVLAGLLVTATAIGPAALSDPASPSLRMTVFEVGQGTAVLLEVGERRLLYDTGPAWGSSGASAATFTVVPFLRERGITQLDRIIISHDDRDHSGGLPAVLETGCTARIEGGEPLAAVRNAGRCAVGDRWRWGDVRFTTLWPPRDGERTGNAASCVLRVEVAGRSLLLAGDIEAAQEARLLERLREPVDVLLVPHHGSGGSSTPPFVAATAPRVAIFPVGHRNAYGFPDPAVVERYRCAGATVYRTGRDGALQMEIDADGTMRMTAWRDAHRRLYHEPGGRPGFRARARIHYDAGGSGTPHLRRERESCGN